MNRSFELKSGRCLIAHPFSQDPIFMRSVIFLTEYSSVGAMGFILNKATDLKIHDVFNDFPAFDAPLYYGGPVDQDVVYFIHSKGDQIKGSVQITKNLWLGGGINQVKELILNEEIQQSEIIFFIGYSGWSEYQLDGEMEENTWIVGPMKKNYINNFKQFNLWKTALKDAKTPLAFHGEYAYSPSLN